LIEEGEEKNMKKIFYGVVIIFFGMDVSSNEHIMSGMGLDFVGFILITMALRKIYLENQYFKRTFFSSIIMLLITGGGFVLNLLKTLPEELYVVSFFRSVLMVGILFSTYNLIKGFILDGNRSKSEEKKKKFKMNWLIMAFFYTITTFMTILMNQLSYGDIKNLPVIVGPVYVISVFATLITILLFLYNLYYFSVCEEKTV
jgi:hypothetical protein